ncbi:DUF456 domain-containing protein [Halalkalibacter krulwichiae]|uniref:DUF456 domain-containing protein n=1 Tax=Halalkalibacter krulwichiae TaxID=199441 RepID=A0A1X9MNB1_9BACI|nr:DUF456 family protein [Halalkalibacter krulwichiae]ARK32802.1 hypothetical protein BkAM31D_24690 [Halalkalibacter krulwichiae]
MEIFYWILIIALFIVSFVGLIFPIIPSVAALWGGFLLYAFLVEAGQLSVWFWAGTGLLTLLILVSDLIASQFFVKKYKGSKWGERMAAVGVIVGSFVYPPFGLIIVPFILVFIAEMLTSKDPSHAAKVATASLFAFLSGTFAKAILQLVMVIWFFIEVIW